MEVSNPDNKTLKSILKGTVIALITTIILFLIFSLILTYTNISESTIFPVIVVITGISILIGSFLGNIKIRKNVRRDNRSKYGKIMQMFITSKIV